MKIFETFRPKSSILQNYISYYYIDIADNEGYHNEYICYPHYNNTISLYKSHTASFNIGQSKIDFNINASPLQIFTPLRESILKVIQNGPVYKIGIVFEPFGINQFLSETIDISKMVSSPSLTFFDNDFILNLFQKSKPEEITLALDSELLNLLLPIENVYIKEALKFFVKADNELSIDELAEVKLGISRKHLNRLFKKYIGTSAQKYRSIIRFRQLMNYKLNKEIQHNLTTLSNKAHYTDQSHFIKACKQLTGLTPSQFFKEGKIIGSEDTFWNFTS